MCGHGAEETILIDLVLPQKEATVAPGRSLLNSFGNKFEKLLFSKILDKETFMRLTNAQHNSIINHLFSPASLAAFASAHPHFK